MGAMVRIVFDICLFQKGPQHLPYSPLLFYLSLLYIIGSYQLMVLFSGI